MNDGAPPALEVEHRIDPALRAFDGHFPGAPVLPGAYLLALVQRTIALHPEWAARIGNQPLLLQVKYFAAVGPGQTLHIQLDAPGAGVAFTVRCGSNLVARGQFAAATHAHPPQA